ncbi:hypothetical protein [Polynucleobacter necessarius]|uniref:hypothetical protein n=1 Tax=Polynucleobacter necessarius TaxID=576610 RepID=UPI000E096437|nr:hypothetical protein [Polynucleobacter necessarius]
MNEKASVYTKKILITGASGQMASIARDLYCSHSVELWSTKDLVLRKNESLRKSADLADSTWWKTSQFKVNYDIIFHFAEPVKKKLTPDIVEKIIESHTAFLINATKYGAKVVYPLTAYRYDQSLSFKNRQYRNIKERVAMTLLKNEKILLPILHPVVDFGNGLNSIRNLVNKVPIINPFSEFNAELPVLCEHDLKSYMLNIEQQKSGATNVYTEILKIKKIFNNPNKKDISFISALLKTLINTLPDSGIKNILINGRKIYD